MNFLRLIDEVKDESSAVMFLQNRGILHSHRLCNKGHDMTISINKNPRWRCRKRECEQDTGIRVGTWYAASKISFRMSIFFMYWWSKEKTSIEFCRDELDMSDETTVDWNNYMREVFFKLKLSIEYKHHFLTDLLVEIITK